MLVLRLAPGGLLLCAPECGSWTVVSRGTSRRNPINVLGDCAFEFVRRANMTLGRLLGMNRKFKAEWNSHGSLGAFFLPAVQLRLVCLLGLAVCAGAIWLLEQPLSAEHLFSHHPRMDWFLNRVCFVPRQD